MNRKQITTILVIIFTVVLSGVAIFTAVRLYQNRQTSVAPTAPTSIPRAAESAAPVANTTACSPVTVTLNAPKCGDSCTASADCPTDHTCSNNKCVLTACTTAGATCDTTKCTQTNAPKCGDTCTTNTDCPTDHTCSNNKCVLTACQNGAICNSAKCATVTAASCNNTCDSNTPCASGLSCVSGACRNPSCTNDTDCICQVAQVPTATPTSEPSLPNAGTSAPTIIGGVIGILAILGALVLAL